MGDGMKVFDLSTLGPFDPNDPLDKAAERARQNTIGVGLTLLNSRPVRQLDPQAQFYAMIAGMLTGVICVGFSMVKPEGQADVIDFLRTYLDQAHMQVEGISGSNETRQ